MSPSFKKWSFTAGVFASLYFIGKLLNTTELFQGVDADINGIAGFLVYFLTVIVVFASSSFLSGFLKLPQPKNQILASFLSKLCTFFLIPVSLLLSQALMPSAVSFSGSLLAWGVLAALIATAITADDWNCKRIDSQVSGQ